MSVVMQNSVSLKKPEVSTTPRPRLRTRLTVSFVVLAALTLIIFIAGIMLGAVRPYLRQEIKDRLREGVALAALGIDVEAVARLTPLEQLPSPTYEDVLMQLRAVRAQIVDARFVYIVRQGSDGQIYFVADAEEVPEDASPPGSVYSDAGPVLRQSIATLDRAVVEDDFYEDEWGVWLSAYAPLYTADGQLSAVLAIDLAAADVRAREAFFLRLGALALLVFMPFIALGGWTLGGRLTGHLTTLIVAVERVTAGDLNYEAPLPEEAEAAQLAEAFNAMTHRLRETVAELENRVAERTRDLGRQAAYLRAAGEVSRVAASILDLDELLTRVTELISEQFGFYHAGIFMLDESREWAVLRAASSEGGQRMIARMHRLGVGAQGIVGYVTQTGRARIALDVGDDMVWFDNPDLPETHSEMALPLIVGEQIIGALDVQSRAVGAFKNEDVTTLRILADQLSVAIANALVFAQRQETLQELQRAYAVDLSRAWMNFMAQLGLRGYHYTPRRLGALTGSDLGVAIPAVEAPHVTAENTLLVPLLVSGLHLGVLRIQRPSTRPWAAEEITFAYNIAQELAQALESARLYQDSRRQAAREQLTGDITARMRETLDVETILRTALREVGDLLGLVEAEVRLGTLDDVAPRTAEEVPA